MLENSVGEIEVLENPVGKIGALDWITRWEK